MKKISWIAAAFALIVPFRTASAETATPVGSDTCIACHAERGESFKASLHNKKITVTKKVEADKACETCHGPGSLHAAAAGDKTNPGFATIRNPSKTDPKETSKICFTCHNNKDNMLWNTSAHAANGLTCTKCHSVHNGKGPKNLKLSANDTCYQCHTRQKADANLPSHHPLAEGKMECVSCHNPHGGPLGNLKAESVNETCFKCHSEKAGPWTTEHPPVAEACTVCHKPHGSVNEALLKQPMPYLCLTCHKSDHDIKITKEAVPAGSLNKFSAQTRQRCTNCHREIHGTDGRATFKN